MNKNIIITSLLLVFSIVFFGYSDIDLIVQDNFYNFETKKWILDGHLQPYRFIFYDGIKKLLIIIAILLLVSLVFIKKYKLINQYKKGIIIVVLSAVLVPLSVGILKKYTNMPCPESEIRYDGYYPRTKVWESYDESFKQKGCNKCWPAGHASGGFALLSLFFLFKSKRNKYIALLISMSIGWSMGFYKMIVGDHFLSHTIITMILSWLIISVITKVIKKQSHLYFLQPDKNCLKSINFHLLT